MTFVLPFWLTFGRTLLGSHGWQTLLYLFLVAPALFIAMLTINILVWVRKDVRQKAEVSPVDAYLLLGLYVSVLLHGYFLIDGGDSEASLNSVMTVTLGEQFLGISTLLSEATFWLSFGLLITCIVIFAQELSSKKPY